MSEVSTILDRLVIACDHIEKGFNELKSIVEEITENREHQEQVLKSLLQADNKLNFINTSGCIDPLEQL